MGGDKVVGGFASGQTSTASDAVFHVGDANIFLRTPRQLDHTLAVQRHESFLGIVVEVLANHDDGLAVAIAARVGKADVRGERDVAGHFFPEKTEFIPLIPDVVAGGVDGVLLGAGLVTGTAGYQRAADVRLAVEDADGRVKILAGPVKIRWRRHLRVRGGAGLRPGGDVVGLSAEQEWRGANYQDGEDSHWEIIHRRGGL